MPVIFLISKQIQSKGKYYFNNLNNIRKDSFLFVILLIIIDA